MSDPFVAEIRIFPFNFAPRGWAMCNGQLLPISQNTALFSLLGTNYGGDGKSNFALPNFQGNTAVHWCDNGTGPGLGIDWFVGTSEGVDTVTLLQSEMPQHSHAMQVSTADATTNNPSNGVLAKGKYDDGQGHTGAVSSYSAQPITTTINVQSLSLMGSSFPHNNLMPYLTLNFCIAMQGIFPPRP
jgi:microcystin-dependent protein